MMCSVAGVLTRLQRDTIPALTPNGEPMTISLAELGISPITMSPLRRPPTGMIYGGAGHGKTTELMLAFQDAGIIATSPTVTRPYYSWLKETYPEIYEKARIDWAKANAAHINNPQFKSYADLAGLQAIEAATGWRALMTEWHVPQYMTGPNGAPVSNWQYFENIANMAVASKQAGRPIVDAQGRPLSGFVLDEGTEVLRRVYSDMIHSGQFVSKKTGGVDEFAVMDAAEEWLVNFCEKFRTAEMLLFFACSEEPPAMYEDNKSLHYGKQKAKGGPWTPFARLRRKWCHALDIVLRLTIEGGGAGGPPGASPPATPAKVTGPASAQPPTVSAPEPVNMQELGLQTGPDMPSASPGAAKRRAKRRYWTEANNDWETKFRDFSISYQEDLGLRLLLDRAGYL